MKYILFAITATLASAATAAAGWKEEKDPVYEKKGKQKEWKHENVILGELPYVSLDNVQVEKLPPVVVVTTVSATRTEPVFPTEGVKLPHDPWGEKKIYIGKEWTGEKKKDGWEVSSWDEEKKGGKKWDDGKYDGEWEGKKKKGGKKWEDDEEDEWDGKKKKKGGKKWDDDDEDEWDGKKKKKGGKKWDDDDEDEDDDHDWHDKKEDKKKGGHHHHDDDDDDGEKWDKKKGGKKGTHALSNDPEGLLRMGAASASAGGASSAAKSASASFGGFASSKMAQATSSVASARSSASGSSKASASGAHSSNGSTSAGVVNIRLAGSVVAGFAGVAAWLLI
ncbi:hypothetical protein VTP01DRAFT_9229 [Rhizomucor pusillus]|uniref:uncharacterized protein n=1 Tax=Rhizomucor pusillus TaxID=4840 RepID=UPI0037445013